MYVKQPYKNLCPAPNQCEEVAVFGSDQSQVAETSVVILADGADWSDARPGTEHFIYSFHGSGAVSLDSRQVSLSEGKWVYLPSSVSPNITAQGLLHILVFSVQVASASESTSLIAERGENGPLFEFGSNTTRLLLDRSESYRSEVTIVVWRPGTQGALVAHPDKEQTFFVLDGRGFITVDGVDSHVAPGDLVFVPQKTPHTTRADEDCSLTYVCMNSIVDLGAYNDFAGMYAKISPERLRRFQSGDKSVGA